LKAESVADNDGEIMMPTQLDPLGFGTLIHELLERSAFGGSTDVRELCDFLAPQHLETPTPAEIDEAVRLVEQFMKSSRAEEVSAAKCVLQEVEFLLPWPEDGAQQYLHGYIDCLYQDVQGGWHLIDYKSNQVTAA